MHCRRFVVAGIVQGVFYRVGTQQTALRLGLTGWVRNRPDGAVELVACGDAAKLKKLEEWLWQGPPHARVQQVEESDVANQAFSHFDIR
jgi:acylphosphatase